MLFLTVFSWNSALCIPDTGALSDSYFANISSQSVICFLIFINVLWKAEVFFFFFFNNLTYLFIFGCAGSLSLLGFSSSCGDGRLLSTCSLGASLCPGFSGCRAQALGTAAPWWWMALVAPLHVGSSSIRERTCVSCIGRWILYHWATREAQRCVLLLLFLILIVYLFLFIKFLLFLFCLRNLSQTHSG